MPYAENKGVRIYYEVEGEGPPIVLAHGMGEGGDLTAWRSTGYTQLLNTDYKLILFDVRGHGRSDRPKGLAAQASNPVDDVVAVLDDLGIEKAGFLGYSMGASVGFKQAVYHPDRFSGFMLGGMTPGPWPEEMRRAVDISIALVKLRQSDPEAYFEQMERLLGHPIAPEDKSVYLQRDANAEIEEQHSHKDELALAPHDLETITSPCLLYCGDQDPFYKGAQESVQYMPRAVFISIGGLNHITAFYRSDVIVKIVRQFMDVLAKIE